MDPCLKLQQFAAESPANTGTMLASVVAHIAAKNADAEPVTSAFHSPCPPTIPLDAYIARMEEYMHCSRQCFVIASVLITRLEEVTGKKSFITPASAHRLVLTAVVVAAKTNEDRYLDNRYYAEVGGITLEEMNTLELALLTTLQWNVFVSPDQYSFCNESIQSLYALITDNTTPVDTQAVHRMRRTSVCVDLVVDNVITERSASVASIASASDLLDEFSYGDGRRSSLIGTY